MTFSWELLRRQSDTSTFPWCVEEDFNAVLYMHEKVGGNNHDFNGMIEFRNVVSYYSLANLGCIGEQITWINGQGDGDLIMEKLDRVLYSID